MTNDYGKGRGAKNRIAKAELKAAWNQAIREGRLVNFGDTIRQYDSAFAAQLAVDAARKDGLTAFIVPAHLAEE
jgi:hypothetical protein